MPESSENRLGGKVFVGVIVFFGFVYFCSALNNKLERVESKLSHLQEQQRELERNANLRVAEHEHFQDRRTKTLLTEITEIRSELARRQASEDRKQEEAVRAASIAEERAKRSALVSAIIGVSASPEPYCAVAALQKWIEPGSAERRPDSPVPETGGSSGGGFTVPEFNSIPMTRRLRSR